MASGINDTFRQVGVSVGIAAWGAIFLGSGASKVSQLAAGTPVAEGSRPRGLIEATSSGALDHAANAFPVQWHGVVTGAARQGFISGLNEILVLGALVAFAGALLSLWLVRERDIERGDEPAERAVVGQPVPQPVAA